MAEQRDQGLPPPPLNLQPQGLLSFLQIKNGGQNPQRLVTDLVPTWDLSRHYLETNALVVETTGIAVATADNTFVQFLAAQNYWRYINWLSWAHIPANALDQFTGWPSMLFPTSSNPIWLNFQPASAVQAVNAWFAPTSAVLRAISGALAQPLWLPPGFRLGMWQYNAVSTGGLATLRFQSSISEFRA